MSHEIKCPSCGLNIGLDVQPSWFGSVLVAIGAIVGIGLGMFLGMLLL